MLFALLPAPFLIGLIFKFGALFANGITEDKLSVSLLPWYELVDGMLIYLTPMFTAMICSFLLLEELDEGIGAFYQITPADGYAYLAARIGLPMIWAFAVTVIAGIYFGISGLTMASVLVNSLISALAAISMSVMVVSLAGNRVEGLALSKMMSVSFLGLVLARFVPAPYHYLAAFLPSFWIGKMLTEGLNAFPFALGIATSLLWTAVFARRFIRKIA
jgi:fluoroquinolone transport system permease protein